MKSHSCSSDDEIWSYSPLARMSKRSERETTAASETVSPRPKRTRCLDSEDKPQTGSKQPQKTRKKRLILSSKKKTPVKSEKDVGSKKREAAEEGYCPFCQMPFRILVVESATWHVSDCLSHPVSALQECASGLECDSTIQSHYHRYRHSALAALRSGVKPTECLQSCTGKDTDYSEETIPGQSCDQLPRPLSSLTPSSTQPSDVTQCDTTQPLLPKLANNSGHGSVTCHQTCPTDTPVSSFIQDSAPKGRQVSTAGGLSRQERTRHLGEAHVEDCDSLSTRQVVTSGDNDMNDCDVFLRDVSEMLGDAMEDDADDIMSHATEDCVTPVCRDNKFDNGDTSLLGGEITCVKNKQLSCEHSQIDKQTNQYLTYQHDDVMPLNITVPLHHGKAVIYNGTDHSEKQSTPFTQSPRKRRTGNQRSLDAFFKPMNSKTVTPSTKEDEVSSEKPVQEVAQQWWRGDKSKSPPQKITAASKSVMSDRPSTSGPRPSTSGPSGPRDLNSRGRPARKCPFYKWIPGTAFTVDAFSYGVIPGCAAYFLSHFHSDHYMGLRKSFSQPVYCSQVTANLVRKKIGVDTSYLHTLSVDTVHVICGVRVTFINANHCPGSVMILFQLPNGQVILHTGDFRASSTMENHLAVVKVNQLFLDTTYCDPSYAFPPQDEVIRVAVKMSVEYLEQNPKGLIVVGSYTIGKERLFLAIAEAVNCHICVTSEKKTVLLCLEDNSITKRLTLKSRDAKVHVLPMSKLTYNGLSEYLDSVQSVFHSILAFQPTGWTHSKTNSSLEKLKPKIRRSDLIVYGLPYSEHSSYLEMKRFVQFLEPDKIIPTVNNGNPTSRNKMERLFHRWRTEAREDLPLPLPLPLPPEGSRLRQTALNTWLK